MGDLTALDDTGPRPSVAALAPPRLRRTEQRARAYLYGLVAFDALGVFLGLVVALLARFGGHLGVSELDAPPAVPYDDVSYSLVAVALGVAWIAGLALGGAYDRKAFGLGTEEYKRVLLASLQVAGVVAIICYVLHMPLARGFVAVAFPVGTAALLASRYTARQWLHRSHSRGDLVRRVLAVGGPKQVADLTTQLRRQSWAGFDVVGVCLPHGSRERAVGGVPAVGTLRSVRAAARECAVDTVAITTSPGITAQSVRRLSWSLEGLGVDVLVAPALTDVAMPRIRLVPVAGLPLLHVEEPAFEGPKRTLKRIFDVVGSAALIGVTTPLLVGIALAVRRGDGGTALFRQRRVGAGGAPFTMLKFRTMVADAEARRDTLAGLNEHDGLLFKIRSDPRVTPVGRWLRRYSLDELPQLFNVLRGDMSLVGPRPPLRSEVDRYGDDVRRRLLVQPGITGLWQVSGRADLSWDDTVRLDLSYVENWSLTLDVLILAKTVAAVLHGRGAY
ncbi:MAG: sugar transferase [Nocardioidaceae bacterium]